MTRPFAVALLALALAAGCVGSPSSPSSSSDVEYRIDGSTSRASVTYRNVSGGTTQIDVTPPWSYHYSGAKKGDRLYILAFNRLGEGTLKAQIYARGSLIRESESTRAFGTVSVSGTF